MTLPNDETPQGGWYADEIWLSGDSLDGKHTGGMGCWSYNECDVDPDCEHIRYVRADLHDAEVLALRKRVEAADALDWMTHNQLPLQLWRECDEDSGLWVVVDNSKNETLASGETAEDALIAAYRATGDA